MSRAAASRAWADAGYLALCIAVAGLASLAKGQDANWDLQNYHFYDPWALVHGRLLTFDVVAAQLQTFHNPALDLAFFAMVAADWPPRLIAFVLAVPAGVAAFFLGKIVLLLFPGEASATRATLRTAAFAIGITGAIGWAVLGTTMNEWPIAALTLAAVFIVVRAIAAASWAPVAARSLMAAGFIAGLASGLKLTAATYALAMCVALLFRRPLFQDLRAGVREALWFAFAVLGGLAVSIGWWGWMLWSQFANPVFPYLNQWFRSPWWDAWPVLARAFGPFTLGGWLTFPYDMLWPRPFFVAGSRVSRRAGADPLYARARGGGRLARDLSFFESGAPARAPCNPCGRALVFRGRVLVRRLPAMDGATLDLPLSASARAPDRRADRRVDAAHGSIPRAAGCRDDSCLDRDRHHAVAGLGPRRVSRSMVHGRCRARAGRMRWWSSLPTRRLRISFRS